ncbi:MAG: hypothetical protein PHH85_04215 [Candidatus Methanoperedens sp.]|nr:hypothetical protein [Candidatus Methanoperedens sp.]
MALKRAIISLIFLLLISSASAANEYRTTYTINVKDDGAAVWNVEYRTQLFTQADTDAFKNYSGQINSVYLKDFKELMQNSVSAASNATSRKMMAGGFTGEASIENAPTGNFGVVHYSFTWTNFAKLDRDKNIYIGDVFAGGLYLSKDNALIIRYPSGYTAEMVTPQPDLVRDGMIWYGLRSFNSGEPTILLKPLFSWMPYAVAVIAAAAAVAFFMIFRRKRNATNGPSIEGKRTEEEERKGTAEDTLYSAGTDMVALEDRIVALLKEGGGSLYQSDITKKLDLPKSTVSSALNVLHEKKIIQKIKKGRENLIRLT